MISVITIEREFGCGSAAIARKLAARLNWRLWDGDLTKEIARLARVDPQVVRQRAERLDPLLDRLSKVFVRASFERHVSLEGLETFDADRMVVLTQRVVEEVASAGNCVIVGRGSPYFLREWPNVFRSFVYASRPEKLRRLQSMGRTMAEAEDLLDTIDRERITFAKKYFGKDWPCRRLYHLMVNSGVGDDVVIDLILHHISALNHCGTSLT